MGEPSQTRILKRVQKALAKSPLFFLRELVVEKVGSALVVSGQVETFYYKQVAQEEVRALAGRMKVINIVEVDDDGQSFEAEPDTDLYPTFVEAPHDS
jgi:hypothetical protein